MVVQLFVVILKAVGCEIEHVLLPFSPVNSAVVGKAVLLVSFPTANICRIIAEFLSMVHSEVT